jgi:hypothetical protein
MGDQCCTLVTFKTVQIVVFVGLVVAVKFGVL